VICHLSSSEDNKVLLGVQGDRLPCNRFCSREEFAMTSRRMVFHKMFTVLPTTTIVMALSSSSSLATSTDATTIDITTAIAEVTNDKISIPIEYIPALSAYVVHFYLFGERFGAIIDTGSPFLAVPSTCSKWSYKYVWGCYHPELTMDSGYKNTIEGFDNNQGTVVWRKAGFTFDNATLPQNLTFGVFGPDLLDGPGGVFFGLIKNTDKWIRPSFLGQTGYTSFCVDLRQAPQLTLSKHPMIVGDDYIPLVRDLNKRYKAPAVHYTAKAASFIVNGLQLRLDDKKMPTYIIFDTGLSGMAVSEELYEGRNLQARKNKEKSLWGEVSVSFITQAGGEVQLTATKPLTTPLGKATPWTRFKFNLIVLGLAFLDGNAMTIDVDDNKLQFTK